MSVGDTLTVKQWAIVRLIGQGLSRAQIADELDLTEANVRETVRRLCERFGCRSHALPLAVANADVRVGIDEPGAGE